MQISILKSKIHLATITGTHLDYEGSIAIDAKLMEACGLFPGEKVAVLNHNNGNRFETYTILGEPGQIELRGPAARLGKKGEKVIILSYALVTPEETKTFKPNIVRVDDNNKIK
ncbi:MAG: aspartate 1-decarboxylase [Candidatus Margulisiibacteriota bacterium]